MRYISVSKLVFIFLSTTICIFSNSVVAAGQVQEQETGKTVHGLSVESNSSILAANSAFRKRTPFSASLLSPQTLQLKTSWFSIKYIHNDQKPANAFGFFSMTNDFRQVLSKHPAALKVGRQANTYQTLRATGSLIMLAGAVKLLIDSSSSDFDNGGAYTVDLGLVLTGGILSFIGKSKVTSLSKKAVQIYYEENIKVSSM